MRSCGQGCIRCFRCYPCDLAKGLVPLELVGVVVIVTTLFLLAKEIVYIEIIADKGKQISVLLSCAGTR